MMLIIYNKLFNFNKLNAWWKINIIKRIKYSILFENKIQFFVLLSIVLITLRIDILYNLFWSLYKLF